MFIGDCENNQDDSAMFKWMEGIPASGWMTGWTTGWTDGQRCLRARKPMTPIPRVGCLQLLSSVAGLLTSRLHDDAG